MDNIPERELPNEPRRGVAPFAGGIEEQGKDSDVSHITYRDFLLGDLGKYFMFLAHPHIERLHLQTNAYDRAFTIDLAGRLRRGNLRDFIRQGYFQVYLFEQPNPSDITEADTERLKGNLWIDNTETIISFDLIVGAGDGHAVFFREREDEKKRPEHFVLPNNPEILQAIRINVSNIQENPTEPNSPSL